MRLPALVAALALPLSAGAAELPTPKQIHEAIQELNRGAKERLPPLSRKELETLLVGEVVRRKDTPNGAGKPERVFGVMLTPVPASHVWIVLSDVHFARGGEYSGKRLTPPGVDPARSYGFLDLPWPVADRHWVVDVSTNARLAQQTENRCWERHWDLPPGADTMAQEAGAAGSVEGVTPDMAKAAIATPVNKGAWTVVSLPGGMTLVSYQLSTVVGGDIPADAISEFALRAMRTLLKSIVEKAKTVPEHYDASHPPIPGADGKPIPFCR